MDDVVVLNDEGPYRLVVERQVKRMLEIIPSGDPWRKTMRQCLESLESSGDEIDGNRHRLGVTASGPVHGLEILRGLGAYASAQKSARDLMRRLPNLGRDHRRIWGHLTETIRDLIIERDAKDPGSELVESSAFRIARRLVVEIEPTEQVSPRYPYLRSVLEDRVLADECRSDSAAVYRLVEELAQEWGPRAGVIDVGMLRGRLQAKGVILRGDPEKRSARVTRSGRTQLVSELEPADALLMEVHPVFKAPAGSDELTVLPPYIPRPSSLDDLLRRELSQAAEGSRLVMVVGGSSTGKSRSCWEAVRAELPAWRIVQPLDPERPAALLRTVQEGLLEPRTVLWLNDANLYLLVRDYAAQVAATLQALLTDRQRGPVLVLGTMWPDFWYKLTEAEDDEDALWTTGNAAVRQLADLAVTIKMPPAFTESELTRAAALVESDPRLTLARDHASSGRITQFLAGAPHLWQRYEQSEGAARGILHAAMDARRYGHGPLISEDFLRTAVEGYMDEATWHSLDDDWFTSHLANLLKPHRQLPGPLTRYRPRSDQTPLTNSHYQLADFLYERSRDTREKEQPAQSLWKAAATYSRTDTDMLELANSARRLGVVNCEELYLKAAECGDTSILHSFARRLIALSRFEHAELLIKNYHLGGYLLGELSAALSHAGRFRDAKRLARQAYAASRNVNGQRSLAHHLLSLDLIHTAARIYSWAADRGDPVAFRWLTTHHEELGDRTTAERLAHTALTEHGSPSAAASLAQLRAAAGQLAEAERLCQLITDHGHAELLVSTARERSDRRDHTTALFFYRAAAAAGHPKALEWMSWHIEGQGDFQYAEDLAHAAAAVGNSHALHGLAHLRFVKGRIQDAERLNQAAAKAGSVSAREWLIRRSAGACTT
ncbi:hypothetical protein AB0E08_35390 [Streptomyces sp. NPDC048281]|uniref:tetratricopeptide repeat protein n=1 Tax=Streptomyces sp. NPDC048281 TaxID=3154715 RepID=UPI00343B44CE